MGVLPSCMLGILIGQKRAWDPLGLSFRWLRHHVSVQTLKRAPVLLTTEPSLQLPSKEKRITYQRDKGIILEEAPKLPASSRDELYQYPDCFFRMVL